MKIIFEGVGESSQRFIYAEYFGGSSVTIRIENLKEPIKGQEITLDQSELEPFIERLKDLFEQVKSPN